LGLGAGVVVFFDEVGEMQGAREASGACADDQDVGFELFALDFMHFSARCALP
jgi:hypothetical protein